MMPPALATGLALFMVVAPALFAASRPAAASVSSRPSRTPHGALATVRIPPYGAYLGADPNYTPGIDNSVQAKTLDTEIGRSLGIVSFFTAFNSTPSLQDLRAVYAEGSVPMVSMHCGGLDSAVAAGEYDTGLRRIAAFYKMFGHPMFLRWFWEMNLPTSGQHAGCLGPNSAQWSPAYIAAFRHIKNVFRAVGATNVAFVWCPSDARFSPNNMNVNVYWPGSAYVDWVGADLYDRVLRRSITFARQFGPFYAYWTNPAHGGNKPLVICETGSPQVSQTAWLSELNVYFPQDFPRIHALVYIDANDEFDYRLVPGGAGLKQFAMMAHEVYFIPFSPATGYVVVSSTGKVAAHDAPFFGSIRTTLRSPVVGIAEQPQGAGYWLVTAAGTVYAFGGAPNYGSIRTGRAGAPVVGIAASDDGRGYWLATSKGAVFGFGDAHYLGGMGGKHLNRPIVGISSAPNGPGYWMIATDGGVFTYGGAHFFGSLGSLHLRRPIDGMTASPGGSGYWLVGADGGVFTFGAARYLGSLGHVNPVPHITAISPDPTGGYRLLTQHGAVYQFPGPTVLHTSLPGTSVVGIAPA
jgi:hypothetical protein